MIMPMGYSFIFDYQLANEMMQYPGALTAAQVFQDRRQAANTTDYFRDWNGLFHFKFGSTTP